MKRAKKATVVPPLNIKEAERVLSEYARADARIEQINASMDEEFTIIREKYADELQEHKEVIKLNFKKVQMFSESHPELFKKKKSVEMSHGTVGFRTGTPKLKTLKGFTWAAVLTCLKAKKAKEYIRVKEEPVKELFIANRADSNCKELMNEVGVEVVQDDTFYIDLKKEETAQP
ncbi:host-nuclease inhibitor Gam family protein [Tenacibaculum maritimum]|uniref:host-nuclease inhibitor Gam family protein n=1 Tax=Tenacibaculum maritimum TaxID=107401 RepID=UPI0012E5959B|nr:host-nuclease inhibitor Gam family protein [Tenacibaculum maritimum]CAA0247922.1 Mu-like prophage host-nuclease inhibitor protein Gam [Tenacibaculum maritimum]